MTHVVVAAVVSENGFPTRRGPLERLLRFVDAVRWLCSHRREAAFTRWYALRCERCGGKRNYRVYGHFQVVCFDCASPKRPRIRPEALVRNAHERRN